jgi:hypothetical protein
MCCLPLQCRDIVIGLAPAAVQWLRMNADPSVMCSSVGVCGAAPHLAHSLKVRVPMCVMLMHLWDAIVSASGPTLRLYGSSSEDWSGSS